MEEISPANWIDPRRNFLENGIKIILFYKSMMVCMLNCPKTKKEISLLQLKWPKDHNFKRLRTPKQARDRLFQGQLYSK